MSSQFIETGEIVAPHGIRGEVKVYPWADSPDQLLRIKKFLISGQEYTVQRSRVQGNCVLLKLMGIDTVEQAESLRGSVLTFDKTVYKPASGYYIADLIGMDIYCDDFLIGKLSDVLQYPGNDVWVVTGNREYMIPAVPEFILKIDQNNNRAVVRMIEGMASDEN